MSGHHPGNTGSMLASPRCGAKPPTALERPASLLIRLDQRDENVELIILWCPNARSPKASRSPRVRRDGLRIGRICMVALIKI